VTISPSNKSPFSEGKAFPLFGETLVPSDAADASREPENATPAYSMIANRKVPEMVSETVNRVRAPSDALRVVDTHGVKIHGHVEGDGLPVCYFLENRKP